MDDEGAGAGHDHGGPVTADSIAGKGMGMGRRERKKRETRQRIYRAAFELFSERGFEATTVEEIGRRADVAKGTVFNYFPTKAAFLTSTSAEWMERMMEELGPVSEWEGPLRRQLKEVFAYLTRLAMEDPPFSRLVLFETMRQIHSSLSRGAPTTSPSQELEEVLRATLERGQESGAVRKGVPLDHAASLLEAVFARTLIRRLVWGGSAEDTLDALSEKLDIIFTGLTP
jgi:AcrR family transcriptional regulator